MHSYCRHNFCFIVHERCWVLEIEKRVNLGICLAPNDVPSTQTFRRSIAFEKATSPIYVVLIFISKTKFRGNRTRNIYSNC